MVDILRYMKDNPIGITEGEFRDFSEAESYKM